MSGRFASDAAPAMAGERSSPWDFGASLPPEPTTIVGFPDAFPSPGAYRLVARVRVEGRIETGVFDVTVE